MQSPRAAYACCQEYMCNSAAAASTGTRAYLLERSDITGCVRRSLPNEAYFGRTAHVLPDLRNFHDTATTKYPTVDVAICAGRRRPSRHQTTSNCARGVSLERLETICRFHPGNDESAPLLLAIPGRAASPFGFLNFCRSVSAGSGILAAPIPHFNGSGETLSRDFADGLALSIRNAVHTHELTLVPVVVVGHAEGADAALDLIACHADAISAAIIINPTHIMRSPATNLGGMDVLLAPPKGAGSANGTALQIEKCLVEAGARVICERVPRSRVIRKRDELMARIFLSALFR